MTSTGRVHGDDRPNLLIVMTDEHGAQFSETYGHPFIRTSAMDRLAREGATFDSAYCNNPLCVPSRLSFMTGRYSHNCQGWDNVTPLPVETVTWPYLLRAQGYEVVLSGKMHLIGPDSLHGFERQLSVDLHAELRHPVYRWGAGIKEATEPWTGVTRTGARVPEGSSQFTADTGGKDPMKQPVETGPGITPEIEADDLSVERAIAFLNSRRSTDSPFALCVGLIAPHFPFVVPEPFFSQYFPDYADLPELPAGHLDSLPVASKRLRRLFGFWGHTDEQVRRARAAYYGLISYADSKIGEILEVLDQTGLSNNTVVVHTSDHGEMLGEHGLWRKMSFYEQSVRVPLQIRWPGRSVPGQRIPECVSLVDVTATLIDAAGADSSGFDGHSLVGLVDQSERARTMWSDEVFAEDTSHGTDRPRAMLRRGHWKFCMSGGKDPEAELYNLTEDPGEFINRSGDKDIKDIESDMRNSLLERWEPEIIDAKVRAHQDSAALIRSTAKPGNPPLF